MDIENNVSLGFVIIGRNEGDRLIRCINSIPKNFTIVYVDSGSTDGSLDFAQEKGVIIVNLDLSIPFTAARARNEGWRKLVSLETPPEFIHFLDGDCALAKEWISPAITFLNENQHYALVCGQRKELYPDHSIYNAMCDQEWNTPIGEAKASGGDFIIRREAIEAVGGFNDAFIAGEEPEMCFRLRERGFKIFRFDAIMTFHDANISRFSQWWKRATRCGYAYALGAFTHGKSDEHFKVRELFRVLLWGGLIPLSFIGVALIYPSLSLVVVAVYAAYFAKILRSTKTTTVPRISQACFLCIGKFAEMLGVLQFVRDRFITKSYKIIEYK